MTTIRKEINQNNDKDEPKQVKENVVIGGGGMAGVHAYPSAIKELRKRFDFSAIKRVAGASIGSITALMVCLDIDDDTIEKFISSIHFPYLRDSSYWPTTVYSEVTTYYGIYRGVKLADIIKGIFALRSLKDTMTFAELKALTNKDLYVVVAKVFLCDDVETSETIYFSRENAADTPIVSVIKASASASPYFQRVRLEEVAPGKFIESTSPNAHAYSDGGWRDNFPIQLFDDPKYLSSGELTESKEDGIYYNPETLGLALVTPIDLVKAKARPRVIKPLPDGSLSQFFFGIMDGGPISSQAEKLKEPTHRQRTVMIERCGVGLADFETTKQNELNNSGFFAVIKKFGLLPGQSPVPPKPIAVTAPPVENKNIAVELVTFKEHIGSQACISSFWFRATTHHVVHEQLEVDFENEESKKSGESGVRLFDVGAAQSEAAPATTPAAPSSATKEPPKTKSTCSVM